MSRFFLRHRVAFHETDAMGVVHHSNHVKYFEQARVEWLRARGLIEIHHPYGPYVFAVHGLEAKYLRPARFDDELETHVEVRLEGIRLHFQYAIRSLRTNEWIATGSTTLVPVNTDLKPARLPADVVAKFRTEPWSEEWPPRP